jgi:hypothetical protein
MANPFQQKARQRKIIYIVLILALFTGSLLHRNLVVQRQAEDLQLRESARGEVELTSSFVRLSLTGSRGLATTILWATAIDRMARHEWNELELLVASISKLQPYFITPWVFQSWNLAFNVAVECDRPRDKYYYVSRGLELLAEGERRNQGTPDAQVAAGRPRFPGNPEMRHYMGFYYQLKIGNSDEKKTMRCLLDLSCIDPLKRHPDKFWYLNERGQRMVKLDELTRLCQDHPRLVRRLREQLGYDTPSQIVKFLEDNRDVPTRFKRATSSDQKESELEEPRRQFPILPPVKPRPGGPDGPAWPNPAEYQMTPEALDVFVICRTWYQYAQEPLPPPMKDPGVPEKEREYALYLDKLHKEQNINFRPAKIMAMSIFRGYPSRAQAYVGENLEFEGWFDEDGWLIKGEKWFDRTGATGEGLRVGVESKYHAGPAWSTAYEMYREYGIKNGLYLSPGQAADLTAKAVAYREQFKLEPQQQPPPLRIEQRDKWGPGYEAHLKLIGNSQLSAMSNYDGNFYQAAAEKDAETVLAHKLLYEAGLYNRNDQYEALALYEQAWPLWMDVFLRYPHFADNTSVQDDIYEPMVRYLRLTQVHNPDLFRALLLGMAQMSVWPHPNWVDWGWIDTKSKIVTVRVARGPLESVAYYAGPEVDQVRDYWFAVTFAAGKLGQLGFAPPVPLPGQASYVLAGSVPRYNPMPPPGWRYLIEPSVVTGVRQRFGLVRAPAAELPPEGGPIPRPQVIPTK